MKTATNQLLRQQVISFFLAHNSDRRMTRNHFGEQGLKMRTVDRALEQYLMTGNVQYRQSSGRIPVVGTAKNAAKLKRRLIKNPSLSGRAACRELQIPETSVRRLKKQLGVVTRTKQKAPLYKKDQTERAKRGSKKLYKQLVHSGGEKFVIMDDETYVPCDSRQIPGKEFWNDIPGVDIPAEFKVKQKEKFPAKFLVWQAISQDGVISDVYVTKATLNGQMYLNDIIKGPLLKFLRSQREIGRAHV
jgi:hypothetical protein